MVCNEEPGQKCNQHPSTQWGVCTKTPAPQRVSSLATALRWQRFLEPPAPAACACRLRLPPALVVLALALPYSSTAPDQPDWDVDHEDDEPLPVDFHFYTPDPLLYNSKLHINEDSPMAAPRIPPEPKDEL